MTRGGHARSIGGLETAITRHDVELSSMRQTMERLAHSLEELKDFISRTRGIAVGLGMAGGAIVSLLAVLVEIIK